MQSSYQAVILAAGRSRRFNTHRSKLSYTLCGQPMIAYPLEACNKLNIPAICVIGHQKEEIIALLDKLNFSNLTYVEQKEQRGTGHAVLCAQKYLHTDHVLIMNGDMPLVDAAIIQSIIQHHETDQAAITFAIAYTDQAAHYGRVVKQKDSIAIIEARDCDQALLQVTCINAGIYLIQRSFLDMMLNQLSEHENGEFYITDLIALASKAHKKIATIEVPFERIRGVNTLQELSTARALKQRDIISYWMDQGVDFIMPETTYVEQSVTIGSDTTIGAGVILQGATSIGNHCTIGASSVINSSTLHHHVVVKSHTIIENSIIKAHAALGPCAHIRNHSLIEEHAVIGNFVEINKTHVGAGTKAKHLAYLGNASLGSQVTIGAGTITCNYNGFTKEHTTIFDHAFIGCNSALVAPVTIGADAIVAAGSVITKDVPSNALAIGRALQINKNNYAAQLRAKYSTLLQRKNRSTTNHSNP